MHFGQNTKTTSHSILGYLPAKLSVGKRWFVEFYAMDPETNFLRRKRLAVPPMRPARLRRDYAASQIIEINARLAKGWNPFMAMTNPKEYVLLTDIFDRYVKYIEKMTAEDLLRPKTRNGYLSYLKTLVDWNDSRTKPAVYVYQLNQELLEEFLEWLWLDRGRAARTRDNYLMWLRTLFSYLKEKGHVSEDPTEAFTMLQGKRKANKNRTVIPKVEMLRIKEYLIANRPHFLLACYVIYYCFIRPKEMSHIRLRDISIAKSTISISKKYSKNRKDAVVTLPDHVTRLMLDLQVFNHPDGWYLFGKNFEPGEEHCPAKHFGDYWTLHMKKALKLPEEYKFYSLKDTGITDLIKDNADLLTVRDQARHSSLQMTDLYTPMEQRSANEDIKKHESYF